MVEILSSILSFVKLATITDLIDIAIVAYILYFIFKKIRHSSAERLIKGILLLLVIMQLSDWLHLYTIHFLLANTMQLGLIAIVIMFQPELRKILEQVGMSKLRFFKLKEEDTESVKNSIAAITQAATSMSWSKTGALIVFERNDKLDNIVKTGTVVDAQISEELVKNIFYPKSPLHDGAVVVSENRVRAAACLLPLSANLNIAKELGTRHRAALGMCETTDAVVLVVSEETGTISLVTGGILKRHLAPETLERLLIKELVVPEDEEKKGFFSRFKRENK